MERNCGMIIGEVKEVNAEKACTPTTSTTFLLLTPQISVRSLLLWVYQLDGYA